MKEIKFRVWTYWRNLGNTMVYTGDLTERDNLLNCMLGCKNKETIKSDFMQYIGIKDKNDTEIYEGDIIRCDYLFFNKESFTGYIEFKDGSFVIRTNTGLIRNTYDANFINSFEVIGNIYENPNLLKNHI